MEFICIMSEIYAFINFRVDEGEIKMDMNNVYCMDNLELLKLIEDNSIDLIYCDILYNTGKKFKDYEDNLGTPQQAIEWYRPRLVEMKRVLKDTGSIYLQCDYRLVHYLKVEMDKIFGIKNYIDDIIWWHKRGGKSKFLLKRYDNILFYANNIKRIKYNQQRGEKYNFNGKSGQGKLIMSYTGELPYPKELIYQINNGKSNFKLDENGSLLSNVWETTVETYHNRLYDTQKPKALIERIIKASSNEGDIVADFFMGSGTTMVVAKELGRRYIGCAIDQRAVEITEQRLKELDNIFTD